MKIPDTQTLKGNTPLSQYIIVISASIIIMLCAGAIYAWSIFVAPLQSEYGFSTAQTQIIYGIVFAMFMISQLFVNRILRKFGTRLSTVAGAVFFASGYLVASFSNGNIIILFLGLGLLTGFGMALGYICVLTNLVKWLPNHKGLATGLAVSGFGGGAILLSFAVNPLISGGWQIAEIFRAIGLVYGIVFLINALLLREPPWQRIEHNCKKIVLKKLFKDKRFWILCFTCFTGTFSGLLFNGNIQPIGLSYGFEPGITVIAISLFSLGNTIGRIIWGKIHDIAGGKKTVIFSLYMFSVSMLLLLLCSGNAVFFLVITFLLGFNYASNFVNYASDVSSFWGIDKLDTIYPLVSIAFGTAGIIGPWIGGLIYDLSGNYFIAIIIGAIICSTGILVYGSLMPQNKIAKTSLPDNNPELASFISDN